MIPHPDEAAVRGLSLWMWLEEEGGFVEMEDQIRSISTALKMLLHPWDFLSKSNLKRQPLFKPFRQNCPYSGH